MERDVIVLGGGIAGFAAAVAAAGAGAQVTVVRPGPGATALSAGAWCGPLRDELRAALAAAGARFVRSTTPLPHPSGERIACDHAGEAHVDAGPADGALVCGIAGLAGFHAATLARLWASGNGTEPQHATVLLEGTPAGGWSPVSLAARLDEDASGLARALESAVAGHEPARIVMPAVLGLERGETVRRRLAEAAGAPVAEALAVAPSLPGWRLQRGIDAALQAAGVEVMAGRAEPPHAGNVRLDSVRVRSTRGAVTIVAGAVVLATGKYVGGGIAADDRFVETALGLPVAVERFGRVFETAEPIALTDADARDAQPLMLAGVDAAHVRYANVVIAGTVRSGTDAARWDLGGVAEDGWRAGLAAAREVR